MKIRPLGVSILAVYFAYIGISVIIVQILFPAVSGSSIFTLSDPALSIGSRAYAFVIGLLVLAASIVIWRGLRAGWWLGLVFLALSALVNVAIIYFTIRMVIPNNEFFSHLLSLLLNLWPTLVIILFKIGLIAYLFGSRTLSWFGLARAPISWTIRRE